MAWAERTPRWLTRVGAAAAAVLPHHGSFRSLPRRAARFLSAAALPPEERMLRWIGFLPEQGGALLRPGVADGVAQEEVLTHFRAPLEHAAGLPPLARALALNFETYLPEDLLVKADRCSMAHGLELRSPLLETVGHGVGRDAARRASGAPGSAQTRPARGVRRAASRAHPAPWEDGFRGAASDLVPHELAAGVRNARARPLRAALALAQAREPVEALW